MPTDDVICPTCMLIHGPALELIPLAPCVETQAKAMAQLLLHVGRIDKCNCGETLYWVTTLGGRPCPYTVAGLDHKRTCTGKFAQKREEQQQHESSSRRFFRT